MATNTRINDTPLKPQGKVRRWGPGILPNLFNVLTVRADFVPELL
jgi:hypothetical protein